MGKLLTVGEAANKALNADGTAANRSFENQVALYWRYRGLAFRWATHDATTRIISFVYNGTLYGERRCISLAIQNWL